MEMHAAQSSSNINMTGPEHIAMAASSDHIEVQDHPTPHLLQVPNVLHDAYVMQKTIEELDESDYREKDLRQFLILLGMTCSVIQGFLQYVKKAKTFLHGRVYCTDCGAVLLSHQQDQNLVDEQLVRAASAESEPYSARSFAGQKDFENHLRACFRELQRVALNSRNMLVDIPIPESAGPVPPNLRRAASAISVTSMSVAGEDTCNSDARGPAYTPARFGRSPTPSARPNNRHRAWRINASNHVEVDGDDDEVEVTSGTSTDSTRDVRGEICEQCKGTRDSAIGAGASGEGSGRDDDAGVRLIIDI